MFSSTDKHLFMHVSRCHVASSDVGLIGDLERSYRYERSWNIHKFADGYC